MTTTPTDPSDKALDAAADGAFGGQHTNRRAGYGDQLDMILRVARRGGTLAAGEGEKLIAHYEALVRKAYLEGFSEAGCDGAPEAMWDCSDAKASL